MKKLEKIISLEEREDIANIESTIEALYDPEAMKAKFFTSNEDMSFEEESFM